MADSQLPSNSSTISASSSPIHTSSSPRYSAQFDTSSADMLPYFHHVLMEEDHPSEERCCGTIQCSAYRALAKAYYEILDMDESDIPFICPNCPETRVLAETVAEASELIRQADDVQATTSTSSGPPVEVVLGSAARHPLHSSASRDESGLEVSFSDFEMPVFFVPSPLQDFTFQDDVVPESFDLARTAPASLPSTSAQETAGRDCSDPLGKSDRSAAELPSSINATLYGTAISSVRSAVQSNSGTIDTSEVSILETFNQDMESRYLNAGRLVQIDVYANLPPTLTDDAAVSSFESQLSAEIDLRQNFMSGEGVAKAVKSTMPDAVDLRALLVECANAVSNFDNRKAQAIIQLIRRHATPTGPSASQRLAHYFADALVARLSGMGSLLYNMTPANRPSPIEMLKSISLWIKVSPFVQYSHYFEHFNILKATDGASRLHVVDYGILYGLHWSGLIRSLAERPGGPAKLRITGIDFPVPGIRAAKRLEDTGRRLARYAEKHGVPFEYQAVVASRWEEVQPESLGLRNRADDEILVVCCIDRQRHLMDSTVVPSCPRQQVLTNMRKMNPNLMVQGVVNAACNAPFFVNRFREALYHFSSLFDVLSSTVECENSERLLIEREFFGREIVSMVACEGEERLERPETYRQWQLRIERAGFKQLPLDDAMLATASSCLRPPAFHKNFCLDRDGHWFLIGWKGRIIHALSSWS